MAKEQPVILIIEDEVDINEAYQIVMRNMGYKVYSAYDGKDALALVKKITPDLILLDLRMPHISGISFLEAYDLTKHPEVKVIILSNYDTSDEIDKANELGAADYALKASVSPKQLETIVIKHLR